MSSDYELCTCPDCACETISERKATCITNNQCDCCKEK